MTLLTVPEVAAELRVDESTVRRHIRAGNLPACKPFGVVRVTRTDLDAYLASSTITPPSPRLAPRPQVPAPARSHRPASGGSVRERLRADRKRAA